MKNVKRFLKILFVCSVFVGVISCQSGNPLKNIPESNDSSVAGIKDSLMIAETPDTVSGDTEGKEKNKSAVSKPELSLIYIYNFHVTNRCAACIAIEEATTKTLNTYFSAEIKQGRIKRQILNVDDEINMAVSMKYQAFGSGLFVTRIYKGKETTTDFTGDGFKFAKNKEERFIELLKSKINEYLK